MNAKTTCKGIPNQYTSLHQPKREFYNILHVNGKSEPNNVARKPVIRRADSEYSDPNDSKLSHTLICFYVYLKKAKSESFYHITHLCRVMQAIAHVSSLNTGFLFPRLYSELESYSSTLSLTAFNSALSHINSFYKV